MSQQECSLKIVIIGPIEVGKSCLMRTLSGEPFTNDYDTTIGVDYGTLKTQIGDYHYKLHLWDTSGNHNFFPIVRSYFQQSLIALLVFDLSSLDSFQNCFKWYQQYREICPDNIVILVGNKTDKINPDNPDNTDNPDIDPNIINSFAQKENLPYIRVSAKTQHNYPLLISTITQLTQQSIQNKTIDPQKHNGIKVSLLEKDAKIDPKNRGKHFANVDKEVGCCRIL